MTRLQESYPNGECPDCGALIADTAEHGDDCPNCGYVLYEEPPVRLTPEQANKLRGDDNLWNQWMDLFLSCRTPEEMRKWVMQNL